jgi:CO/xanthine dehydrogenase Mo-binding subunit
MLNFRHVGKSYPRHESLKKVTGRAVYTDDIYLPGMAYAEILRSPYPHARVKNIDINEAKKVSGVLGILLPEECPDDYFNCSGNPPSDLLIKDEKILTRNPLYVGDRIAAVAAISKEACKKAVKKIKVEYEKLPAVLNIKDALHENAPLLHPEINNSNVYKNKTVSQGDLEKNFAESDYIFEDDYYVPAVQHAALEPVGCICDYSHDGKLNVWSTSQTPFQERRILAQLLKIPESNVRVVKPAMGGGFGGRQQLHNQHVGALLSKKIDRPVKIINNREEEMYTTAVRHEAKIHLKIGVTKKGFIKAFHAKVYHNAGAYSTHSPVVTAAQSRKMQYKIPAYKYEGFCVYTNTAVAGAMRGYGNPQITFARELMLNKIAKKINIDPAEFRMKNHLQVGEKMPASTTPIKSCAIKKCLQKGEEIKAEIDKKENIKKDISKDEVEAWGIAFGCHTSGPSSKEGMSSCSILVNDDASINLLVGSADIGQGCETTFKQLAAEQLDTTVENIAVSAADTLNTPYDTGTFASSQMYVGGNAVYEAASAVHNNLKEALAKYYDLTSEKIIYSNKKYIIEAEKKIELSFKEAVEKIAFGMKGTVIIGKASFKALESPPPFAICWAKVALNKKTRTLRIKHVIETVDVGTAVNPKIVEGQIHGGISMGLGYALTEQMEIDKKTGKPISADLLHYKIPTTVDMPELHVGIVESYEPTGPLGAKSVGELSTVPVAPAIVNAVCSAAGEEFNEIPLTKYYVPQGLREDGFCDK